MCFVFGSQDLEYRVPRAATKHVRNLDFVNKEVDPPFKKKKIPGYRQYIQQTICGRAKVYTIEPYVPPSYHAR